MGLIVTNQSSKERKIRAIVGIVLIILAISVDISSMIGVVLLATAGALLFNAISGNCYIYRVLGYSTCPISDSY
ncbi:MAG: DUF2892 domain-containing protein [Candidatus Poseidoniaceae archaeon]|jgi:hypothetical protein|tara:strand:+ start:1081 stop:1302 length:222 start_codon:yes stop_codon:yes gene_type:complete